MAKKYEGQVERKSLENLVRDRNARMTWWLFLPISAVYLIAQGLLFHSFMETAKKNIIQWREQHRVRVAQDLFLQNRADLSDLVKITQSDNQKERYPIQFAVLDQKQRVVVASERVSFKSTDEQKAFETSILLRKGQVNDWSLLNLGGNNLGYLWVETQYPWNDLLAQSGWVFGISVLLFFILKLGVAMLIRFLRNNVVGPLQKISSEFLDEKSEFDQMRPIPSSLVEFESSPEEIANLIESYNRLLARIKQLRAKERELVVNRAKLEVATQVAHDIRSPMAALSLALEHAEELSEKKKEIFFKVLNRMTEISEELLDVQKAMHTPKKKNGNSMGLKKVNLKSAVDAIIAEKRLLLAQKTGIEIVSVEVPDLCVSAEEMGLRRVLSNIIDNAIESMEDSGQLSFKVTVSDGICYFSIKDTGRGMDKELLKQVWKPGFTFGKPNGNGLGLSFVKQTVESWGGRAVIDSAPGKGTVLSLQLKLAEG